MRAMLSALGPAEVAHETDAVNATRVPPRSTVPITDFTVMVEEVGGTSSPQGGSAHVYYVEGEGLHKFAQVCE